MNKEAIDALIEKNPNLSSAREKLEAMAPGNYCLHRSWGFGKIVDYDPSAAKIIIDFEEGKKGHAMAPAFCVDKLEVLKPDDILVRSRVEPDVINELISKHPADLMCEIISKAEGQAMTTVEIERILSRLIGPIKYKKWWTATKKLLLKDPRIGAPIKKSDAYIFRDEPVDPEQEILEQFLITRNPREKILLGDKLCSLSENMSAIKDQIPGILSDLADAIRDSKSLGQADRLHGVWVRNNLARSLEEDVESLEPSSASILDATVDYSTLAAELPQTYYKRYLDLIFRTYPDKWKQMTEDLLRNSSGKFTSECINFLIEKEQGERVAYCLDRWLSEQTIKGPLLFWVVKNRNSKKYSAMIQPLVTPRLLAAMFYAIDHEALQNANTRRIPLGDLLSDDGDLIPDLLADANTETARDLAQTLLLNQGFEELTKKSLLARFIKKFPSIQSLIDGQASEASEEDALIVSRKSFDDAKAEYEDLIANKIPQNKEAIATAREHGDLKENSEYKMARQDQDILLSRKNELEIDLSRARITDFTEATTENIGIGCLVELEQSSTGKKHRYSILGAWDSDPENNILSYKTPLAKELLGKQVGEVASTRIGGTEENWTILGIERWLDVKAV